MGGIAVEVGSWSGAEWKSQGATGGIAILVESSAMGSYEVHGEFWIEDFLTTDINKYVLHYIYIYIYIYIIYSNI